MVTPARIVFMAALVAAAFTLGHGLDAQVAESPQVCGGEGSDRLFCGPSRAEDLVRVPGTNWIVASALGGGLHLIDAGRRTSTQLYPSPQAEERFDRTGYPTCAGPPDDTEKASFTTLGVSLRAGPAGVYTIHVIRYPTVSRVHVFELDLRDAAPVVTWVGCVDAPDDTTLLNSIVPLPAGGFLATHFYERGNPADRERALAGEVTGWLLRWEPRTGWSKVPGTDGAGPNGVEASLDGEWAYVAEWGARKLHKLAIRGDLARRQTVELDFRPDNVHWTDDGMLLLAGNTHADANVIRVVRIDPATLQVTEVLRRSDTEAFFHASVAVKVASELWLGSARATPILIAPMRQME